MCGKESHSKNEGCIYQDVCKIKFHHGDIVYWCQYKGRDCKINFGIVDQEYYDKVSVDVLAPLERRRVNGIPLDEFNDFAWHRVPKIKIPKSVREDPGFSAELLYKENQIMQITRDPYPEGFELIDTKNPDHLLEAYKKGWYVKSEKINPGYPRIDYNKSHEYRIEIFYGLRDELLFQHVTNVGLYKHKAYFTYQEAEDEMNAHYQELERLDSLTDEEWAIEEIEKSLLKFKLMYQISEEEIEQYKKYFLEMPDIAELITRVTKKGLEWRYDRENKWKVAVI